MAAIGSVGAPGAGQIPVEAARQAAVLGKQKEVMQEQGEQAVKLIEAARVDPSGTGRVLDISA